MAINTQKDWHVGHTLDWQQALRRHGGGALLLALAMLALYLWTDAVHGLDRRIYDAAVRTERQPLGDIVIVAIDDASLAQLGAWPWSREVHARAIDRLAAAGAQTIVHTEPFDQPQHTTGQAHLRQLRDLLGVAAPEAAALGSPIARTLDEADAALAADQRLAASMQRAGNVLLGSRVVAQGPGPSDSIPWPPFVQRSALPNPAHALAAQGVRPPIDLLGQAAAGVGHMQTLADPDGAVRRVPLVLRQDGAGMPALALLAAAHSLNIGLQEVRQVQARALRMGALQVRTEAQAVLRPPHHIAPRAGAAFTTIPLYELLAGRVAPEHLHNKLVLIGSTTPGLQPWVPGPGGQPVPVVQLLADQISGIRQGHVFVQPAWAGAAVGGLWVAVLLLLAWGLPRLGWMAGVAVGTGVAALLAGLQWLGLVWLGLWLPTGLAALTLMAGTLGHALYAHRSPRADRGAQSDAGALEADRMMGLALQGQGQLDMAFERLRRVPASVQVQDNLMHLALDFERRQQYDQAQAVYEYLLRQNSGHAQARARHHQARQLADMTPPSPSPGESPNPPQPPAPAGPAAPGLLGRYQIEKELGRGSMGVVYQGRDPRIGRVVAIKALALEQEFDGAALVDARARFFREAESAGRLQHQHIVTIYDAGEDNGLAWIAMELLKGQDLSGAARVGRLLPLVQVVSIAAQVAEALDYAHQQHVVHRDIKPANIMFDAATGEVKVSDFGIARITDSSKTRTGLVLGTPSFMAPEQLAGHPVDGRCDLYALGVTLFQLITGSLPLRGASLSELMQHIARTPAPDVRTLRPEAPPELARIVALALCKDPSERYQTGQQMAHDLRSLGACRTWSAESENRPQRGQFLPDLRTHSPAMGQKDGVLEERRSQQWTAAVDLQPAISKSDSLLEHRLRAARADAHATHSLVYDARSDLNGHNMVDFQETVVDDSARRGPESATGPGAR